MRELFDQYERAFERALRGDADMDQVAALYAAAFIGASPAGVMTGANDDQFRQVMAQGYARYRAIGTKSMRLRALRILPMDAHHCVARVAWASVYARQGRSDVEIDFTVHYLVQTLDGEAKVFG
ncbi:MAG TPA: nuclear transport factor 2 family protein, partial [Phenylobacterium sp.]|nr:nuclear transport factor 2 family protein [Phenylobacterium sp.]